MKRSTALEPLVTVVVPSLNQGRYLDDALASIFRQQTVAVEVFVLDGGSTDDTIAVIERWRDRLRGFRSGPDQGQAAAINEGIALGRAPYVCWLNSDDWWLDGGLHRLVRTLESNPAADVAYGRCLNVIEATGQRRHVWVEPFEPNRLAVRCIIAQPATLIRRAAWDAVGGVDPSLHMAMDYDLWWRIHRHGGKLVFVDEEVAVNRVHACTKTESQRRLHYREAIAIVRKYHGRVPLKWWLFQPFAVWYRGWLGRWRKARI